MLPVIVCIDDETHNNEAIERLLRKKYTVYSTISPTEGLELIQKYQPSVIISDQRMPQMTGVELLQKSIEKSPDSIRLLLTGYTDLESVIAAINEGQIYRYLTKPWEPQDLIITIDKAYETYQLRQELKKQNEQLKSLDKLKTDFMILVTHELRTPLTAITSFSDILREEVKTDDAKVYLSHIQKNTDRLNKLIEDILLITKIKAGSLTADAQEFSLKKEIEAILQIHNKSPSNVKLEVNCNVDTVKLNKQHVVQILQRCIENIVRYAPANSTAQITTATESEYVVINFKNNMSKPLEIKPEELFSLFSRNEKIMNHTKGTGLGLSIAYALATAMNGNVTLNTSNNVFDLTVRIPLAQ